MRLNSIKLSGFKSFVEPTHFQLPGQLVGVVGPNGCGKSNIIDAVRWVLGESKASELRGESMQDVIFNGTNLRKPAGRASVELVFDNADGARRRPVEPLRRDRRQARADARRHEQLLHQRPAGAPARRAGRVPRHRPRPARLRDHRPGHDLAGSSRASPRSCACSSRKPPASRSTRSAGARPRRRLKDTRENLTRVEDILRELNGNLDKLETQAEVAGRYRALQHGRAAEAAPALVPASTATRRASRSASGQAVVAAVAALEVAAAPTLRHAEAELEAIRQAHYDGQRRAARGAGRARPRRALEVSRLEERIRYVAAGRERLVAPARRPRSAERRAGAAREADAGAEHARARRRDRGRRAQPPSRSPRELADARARVCRASRRRCARRSRAATRSAARSPTVQQQIQVLGRRGAQRRRAADARPSARARAPGRAKRRALVAIEPGELDAAQRAAGEAEAKHQAALAALADWQARVPGARRGAARAAGRASTTKAAATPSSARASTRCRRLQEKVQVEDKLKPWLAAPRARIARRACGRGSASSRAGKLRSKRRCASASARSRSAGSTPCAPSPPTRRRRALAFFTAPPARIASVAPHAAAPAPTCCISATRACRRCSATGSKASTPRATSTTRSPRAQA